MAIFSFLIGCVIGLVCALTGWLGFGMSLLAAFGLYLSVSMLVGMALILGMMMTVDPAGHEAEA